MQNILKDGTVDDYLLTFHFTSGSHSKEVDASGSKEKHNQYTRKDTSSTVANDDEIFSKQSL